MNKRSCLALCFAVAISPAGCSDSWRASALATANRVAAVGNSGSELLLRRHCAALMSTMGRTGTRNEATDRCEASGERAGTAATPAEKARLAAVEAQWRPVRDLQSALADLHGRLRDALQSGSAALIPDLIAQFAALYGRLVQAAKDLGAELPKILQGAP